MSAAATFIREHKEQLLHAWLERVHVLPHANGLSPELLRDHLPEVLERIAESIELGRPSEDLEAISQRHGQLRHEIGYDLREVTSEYIVLRDVLMDALQADTRVRDFPPADRQAFHQYLDTAIMEAASYYVQERDRMRQLFIGILGHDLRNPLNTISMMAQRLLGEKKQLTESQLRRITRVTSALERMQRMIDELLDFTRGRLSEGFPLMPGPCDLRELVSESLDELRSANADRDIRSEVPEDGERFHATVDRDRIEQVLYNLVTNALRHGQDPVVVRLEGREGGFVLRVRNEGGIPYELRAALFDPFRTTAGTHGGGLGLGLYISREIAQAHGGSLDLDAESEASTEFRLVLPRNVPSAP